MAMLGCLVSLIVLVQLFQVAFSCPCSWTTCRHQWRNDWRPSNPPQGACVNQRRDAHFIYTRHKSTGSCPSSRGCSHSSQWKKLCSCREVYSCPYNHWTRWTGNVPSGTCRKQSRLRSYNEAVRYVIRQNSCGGIKSRCGAAQYDYRTFCACRFAVCSLGQWSSWTDLSKPVSNDHCASQKRRRSYTFTWAYMPRRDNCNGVEPQSCPRDQEETREKVVTCSPLPRPPNGKWDREDCVVNSQVCTSYCRLQCNIRNGYEISGTDARRCQTNGQWSTPWNSYCKDVQAPTIVCPSPRVVGNDIGKNKARITLPTVVATDNDGKVPRVTNDVGAAVKDFEIKDTYHIVKYTAIDETGNNASCFWQVTVKDTERPTAVTCPDDIKVETNQNLIRVNWKYPTFVDNYDKPPLRISSNKNPGVLFPWGKHKVIYTAFDRANNNGSCEFFVEVGPVKCPLFDPPQHGTRACNKNVQSSNYEMFCNVQCKKGYAFADSTPQLYMCESNGIWKTMTNGVATPLANSEKKPWPDCAPEEAASAAKKEFTFYTGACIGDEGQALNQIRNNFLIAIRNTPLAKFLLCDISQGLDCVVNNVKVYCGSRSKRSGGSETQRIITFDFIMSDTHPSADHQILVEKLQKMLKELGDLEIYLKTKLPSLSNMPSLTVEAKQATAFCPAPKVKRILDGQGSEIERSICVECPIGTHYSNNTQSCNLCEVGNYQDNIGQTSCKPCPPGKLSIEQGATNVTQCYDACKPGEYAHVTTGGAVTCLACPIGSYQPKALSKSCLKCPQGKTTSRVGASALEDCS
ncbi:sushi, von Willebrand factor type A, EGF and pentraxin domain-containing protein 1-like [Actinia tenebrosa]|uniref:Sushi, von Willebrand factor type A, EGF and pentraxin domain-containing protein 1-like n=1 Tax=Actinia tenebrosa TaxID=6105 RepID=A0A6P8HGW1_ACTTE|nr:sushi, von Willebrand factor type A, EGF and pentraxin domain-containing protein 1-like [Actinia tenebrosa]